MEQLGAINYDINGDGEAENSSDASAYNIAFGGVPSCAGSCKGFELMRDLDFREASSYASGSVNSSWTEGEGWIPSRALSEKVMMGLGFGPL